MSYITEIQRRTWAEIDITRLEHNFNIIKSALNTSTKLCCVIKANAYGHGAIQLARLYSRLEADFLAVANIQEALTLRENNVTLPILILGFTPPECAETLCKYNITQCAYSLPYAQELNSYAEKSNVKIKVHIKIDTGMGRLGFICRPEESSGLTDIVLACKLSHLVSEGIFTHFAVADAGAKGKIYTRLQYQSFIDSINYLKQNGIEFKLHHCSNSAALFDYPDYQLDMVRAGIALYGLAPSERMANIPQLHPAMTLKTVISHIKELSPGETIGYGRIFSSQRVTKIATLPIGYADGLPRSSTGYSVLVNNTPAEIVGKICMDQMMIDISGIDCNLGDVVTVFGSHPNHTADNIASHNDTINYEVICNIGERVPRIYI